MRKQKLMKRTNEKIETLMTIEKASLKVDYFWNHHGKLIDWNEYVCYPFEWSNANVNISKVSFTQEISEHAFDFEATQLAVNNYKLGGDVVEINVELEDNTIKIYCKVVVGWG